MATLAMTTALALASLVFLAGCGGGESGALKIGLQGPMTGETTPTRAKAFRTPSSCWSTRQTRRAAFSAGRSKLLIEDDAGDPTQSAPRRSAPGGWRRDRGHRRVQLDRY